MFKGFVSKRPWEDGYLYDSSGPVENVVYSPPTMNLINFSDEDTSSSLSSVCDCDARNYNIVDCDKELLSHEVKDTANLISPNPEGCESRLFSLLNLWTEFNIKNQRQSLEDEIEILDEWLEEKMKDSHTWPRHYWDPLIISTTAIKDDSLKQPSMQTQCLSPLSMPNCHEQCQSLITQKCSVTMPNSYDSQCQQLGEQQHLQSASTSNVLQNHKLIQEQHHSQSRSPNNNLLDLKLLQNIYFAAMKNNDSHVQYLILEKLQTIFPVNLIPEALTQQHDVLNTLLLKHQQHLQSNSTNEALESKLLMEQQYLKPNSPNETLNSKLMMQQQHLQSHTTNEALKNELLMQQKYQKPNNMLVNPETNRFPQMTSHMDQQERSLSWPPGGNQLPAYPQTSSTMSNIQMDDNLAPKKSIYERLYEPENQQRRPLLQQTNIEMLQKLVYDNMNRHHLQQQQSFVSVSELRKRRRESL